MARWRKISSAPSLVLLHSGTSGLSARFPCHTASPGMGGSVSKFVARLFPTQLSPRAWFPNMGSQECFALPGCFHAAARALRTSRWRVFCAGFHADYEAVCWLFSPYFFSSQNISSLSSNLQFSGRGFEVASFVI